MKRALFSIVFGASMAHLFVTPARGDEPVEEVPVSAAPSASAPMMEGGTAATPAIAAIPATATPVTTATPAKAGPVTGPSQVSEDAPRPEAAQQMLIYGYVQGQYESHAESEEQLRQGGIPVNQNRFLVRRARLKVERELPFAYYMFEIDGNTVNGPRMGLQHAEAALLYRGSNAPTLPPMFKLAFGLMDTPFGYEVLESPRTRWFMERSLASRSFFPGEPDLGVRVSGALAWFRYAAAILNGEPLGEASAFSLRDPNKTKDFVLRVGGAAQPTSSTELSFGASIYNGKGFHPGTDATKNQIVWRDLNENGQVDPGEQTALPGIAGRPSENFDRWMVGADAQLRFKTRLGVTQLFGEVSFASNMDRGLYVADPVDAQGINAREIGWYAGLVQEIGEQWVLGFRTDYYNPNADLLDRQGGKYVPYSQAVRTFTPMAAWRFDKKARLVFQYDFIRDHFARDAAGKAYDLKNDAWTLRLQVEP